MAEIVFPEISLAAVKGVLIDLDDTLYDYKTAHAQALANCFRLFQTKFSLQVSRSEFETLYRHHRNAVTERLTPQASCRSRLLAFLSLFESLRIPKAYSYTAEFEDFYWTHLVQSITPAPAALHFLKTCLKQQIPVCIITDMTAQQQLKKIQKLNLEPFIDTLVTSEEVGAEKPNSQIFTLALKKLGISAAEAIMIGDHQEKDILGAENLGIKAYKVYRKEHA